MINNKNTVIEPESTSTMSDGPTHKDEVNIHFHNHKHEHDTLHDHQHLPVDANQYDHEHVHIWFTDAENHQEHQQHIELVNND